MYCLTKYRLGSTVMAKDTEGEVVSGTYYNAWREAVNTYTKAGFEKSVPAVPSYTGHRYDNISGLYYAKARMYSADDKRFTSIDPIKDGLNWYEYCIGNPQRYIDPNGMKSKVISQNPFDILPGTTQSRQTNCYVPTYNFDYYNDPGFMAYTNCYSYAFGMKLNPITREKFSEGGKLAGIIKW